MSVVLPEQELDAYYREAASWDADRSASVSQSAVTAWRVAGAAVTCAVAACTALIMLLPLKRVEPFLVRVDSSTGVVDVVPNVRAAEQLPQAVTRYFVGHYVSTCERFNVFTAEVDYEECSAFHNGQRNQIWYAKWNPSNPSSPLNVHKDGSSVAVQIQSISFFTRASGVGDLAQVRYLKIQRPLAGSSEIVSHWVATVRYTYGAASNNPKLRIWNPLGFRVLDFVPEPEVVPEDVPGTPRGQSRSAP